MHFIESRLSAVSGTIAARLIVVLAGLGASILTARTLGPAGRGQYVAIVTLAAIIAQIGNFGISSSNTLLAARNPQLSQALIVNSVLIATSIGVASAIILLLFGPAMAAYMSLPAEWLWVVSLIAAASLFLALCGGVLSANERFVALNGWQMAYALVPLALLAACAVAGLSVGGYLLAYCAGTFGTAVALLLFAMRGRVSPWSLRSDLFKEGLDYSWRAYLALVCSFLLQRAGIVLLASISGPAEVGLYSVALQVYDGLMVIPASVATVIFPNLVKVPEGSWGRTRQTLLATAALMMGIAVVVGLLAGPLIDMLFGSAFSAALTPLRILLVAVVLFTAITVLSQFIVAKMVPMSLILTWLAGFGVVCVAGPLLIREHGANGAAVAHVLGSTLVLSSVALLALRRAEAMKRAPESSR